MKIKPLSDRVVIEALEAEDKTSGGIYLPDTAKEKPQMGKVVSVGKGRILESGKVEPLMVKNGDKVLFSKYAGNDFTIGDEEHLILKEEEILGIIE